MKETMIKNKKEKLRSNKAITLIALVVTIVVLLILAGVSINTVIGQNGLVGKTIEAKNKWKEAEKKDKEEIDKSSTFIDDIQLEEACQFSMNGNSKWAKKYSSKIDIKYNNIDNESLKYIWSTANENITLENIRTNGINFKSGDTISSLGTETGSYCLNVLLKSKTTGKEIMVKSNPFNLCNDIGYVEVWGWYAYSPNIYFREKKKEGVKYTLKIYLEGKLIHTFDVTNELNAPNDLNLDYRCDYIVEDSIGNKKTVQVVD